MLDTSDFLDNNAGSAEDIRINDASGAAGDDNSIGSRWPREETLALLKIRSEIDAAFRDSALKAPLWDDVSRKLGELGYNRSAKKCKEKFENIYKYHKRTKDGRSSRNKGKNYRFFEQLELFDNNFSLPSTPLNQIPSYTIETPATTMAPKDFSMPSTSTSSSSEESTGKKRKLGDYLESLMKNVLQKQEDLQNKFLEAIEKCEKDRIAREEAWRVEEMARIKREQEFLAQERAIAAAKDAAVLAFLQKIAQQTPSLTVPEILSPLSEKTPDKQEKNVLEKHSSYLQEQDNSAGENTVQMSSSRWPKAEVEALIMMKTDLDLKYQDSGPKGPLWEEISTCMKKLGYNRNAKRCKEKWENINKYYKRVKESNKKRPDDSKTCPYFTMLDSLYASKSKNSQQSSNNGGCNLKPEQILMQMMGQQQQPQNQEDEVEDDDNGDGYQIVANNLSSVTALG